MRIPSLEDWLEISTISVVFLVSTRDATSFKKFFVWVSDVIGVGGKSVGTTDSLELPGPPAEVNIVI